MATHLREAYRRTGLSVLFVTVSALFLMLGGCPPVLSDGNSQADPDPNGNSQTGPDPNGNSQADPITLTKDDDGKSVALPLGEQLVVTLDANQSTGYSWGIAGIDDAVLEHVDDGYEVVGWLPGMSGCGGFETWTFVARSPGAATLQL